MWLGKQYKGKVSGGVLGVGPWGSCGVSIIGCLLV